MRCMCFGLRYFHHETGGIFMNYGTKVGASRVTLRLEALEDRRLLAPTVLDPNLAVRTVVTRLQQPTGIAFFGDNEFFTLSKQTGRVQHVVNGEIEGTVLDL